LWRSSSAAVENLRAKNNALHVSMEKLLGTNSELAANFNSQVMRLSALEAQLAEAKAQRPAAPAAVQPAGGHLLPHNPPEGGTVLKILLQPNGPGEGFVPQQLLWCTCGTYIGAKDFC
jgi:hypothetical protein